jgi:hypothetical protein
VYRATVTVKSSSNDIQDSFTVRFTVTKPGVPEPEPEPTPEPTPEEERPMYGISLSPSGVYQFPSVKPNYETADIPSALPVTVTNTGKEPTGPLTVSISTSSAFTLSLPQSTQKAPSITVDSINKDKTAAFSVRPNGELDEGPHVAIVTVTGNNKISAVLTVSFTVNPPTKVATVPAEVKWDVGINEVIYEGTLPLGTKEIPEGKKLIIMKPVAKGTPDNSITVKNGASLEIEEDASIDFGANGTITIAAADGGTAGTVTNNGTIKTATANNAVLKNLVGLTGTGEVVLTAQVTGVAAPLALGANLEIGAGGSITYTGGTTAAFSATEPKTVTILSENTGTALSLPASIIGYDEDENVTVSNKSASAIILTKATGVGALTAILAAKGNITASGVVNVGSDLEIPKDATLTIEGAMTIETDATLKVTGTLALADNATLVNDDGTIEAVDVNKLLELLRLNGIRGDMTVKWNTAGSKLVVLSSGESIVIPEDVTLTVINGQTLLVSSNATLTVNGTLTGEGSLDVNGSVVVKATGNVTVTGDSSSGLINVTEKYKLPTDTDAKVGAGKNLTGISRTAEKNLVNGDVTIYLGGTVKKNEDLVEAWFDTKGPDATGNYAIATIDGIFNTEAQKASTTLKNINPSWWYYKGVTTGILQTAPDPTNPPTAWPTLWLPESEMETPYNLKKTTTARTDAELTILLWSEANPKEATLEITPVAAGTAYTIIVDWSGLTINP